MNRAVETPNTCDTFLLERGFATVQCLGADAKEGMAALEVAQKKPRIQVRN